MVGKTGFLLDLDGRGVPRIPCLFPPTSGRPAGGQVLPLALARHGPDVDELVPDRKRLDRAGRFEIPECLGQILLEFPHLLGLAAAELVQVGHAQRVGRGVAGIKAVQPQRQGLATQTLALLPVDLRPLRRAVEGRQLGVDLTTYRPVSSSRTPPSISVPK